MKQSTDSTEACVGVPCAEHEGPARKEPTRHAPGRKVVRDDAESGSDSFSELEENTKEKRLRRRQKAGRGGESQDGEVKEDGRTKPESRETRSSQML